MRSLFLSLTIAAGFLFVPARSDAQTFVRRPNGNNVANRSQYQPYGITRFYANSPQPMTRFRASPIYPSTTFWSNAYPSSPNFQYIPAPQGTAPYAPSNEGYGGPAYYPWSDSPLSGGQLGPQPR